MTRLRFVVGERAEVTAITDLYRTLMVQYAGASGDYNPIHTDEPYAREVAGFPTVMVHGMLTMGLTSTVLTQLVGDDRLVSFGGRFLLQVWPGDDLTVQVHVVEEVDSARGPAVLLDVETINQAGAAVFKGTAVTLRGEV